VDPGLHNVKMFKLLTVTGEVLPHKENYPLEHYWRHSIFKTVIQIQQQGPYPELDPLELTGKNRSFH